MSALKYYLSGGTPPAGQERLIIFTRYPEPGKTKTRLIPALGPEGAAGLQRKMTEHAVRTHQAIRDLSIELRFVGGSHDQMEKWLGKDVRYREQSGNDLGERMADAFQTAFSEDPDRIVITGIDSPEITGGILQAAFDALKRHDLVLGPATDGGYYLIGMRRTAALKALPEIFLNVDWGTDRVLESTRSKIAKLKLGCALLAPLDDVDRPEDLAAWERAQADATHAPERPSISVIIPALNEADRIGATLERLKGND
ncbi:MAG: TIGR04282 family arsenosugar biosynthesis glycosyltransferase, partial [Candidatus Hydrogenedentes bacterium]|nr:TIGR04282 family arsenosugar biosynthesis glycosyltransferase [Candidatus Hydrogenedentota bacterium]